MSLSPVIIILANMNVFWITLLFRVLGSSSAETTRNNWLLGNRAYHGNLLPSVIPVILDTFSVFVVS